MGLGLGKRRDEKHLFIVRSIIYTVLREFLAAAVLSQLCWVLRGEQGRQKIDDFSICHRWQ